MDPHSWLGSLVVGGWYGSVVQTEHCPQDATTVAVSFTHHTKHIVVVPQSGILFNDTIEQNLKYGNPTATQEDLERVAR